MGVTNSEAVYNLFEKKIIFNKDTRQLFHDAKKYTENMQDEELYELMDFVKDKHTYINRIDRLLSFFREVRSTAKEG